MLPFQQDILRQVNLEFRLWPSVLRIMINPYWQKTLKDDKTGLVSGLAINLGNALQLDKEAKRLAAVSMLLWTATNLEDDLLDEAEAPRSHCLLSDACLISAFRLAGTASLSGRFQRLILESASANANETDGITPRQDNRACGKSVFLIAPLLALSMKSLASSDLYKLEKSLRYALSAKQLADDVYDYAEDWRKGKRSLAHLGLTSLPDSSHLPQYFKTCAQRIIRLCKLARTEINKISALKGRDILSPLISPVEANCERFLSSLSLPRAASHKKTRSH